MAAVFVVLLAAFAAGLWGTILKPAAYEVQGEFVARPRADLLLIRHEAVAGLGMQAMELMSVVVPAEQAAAVAALVPGDRVRLAVRPVDDTLHLVWLKRRQ